MSQHNKRSAAVAFDEITTKSPSKKKRSRNRAGVKSPDLERSQSPIKDRKSVDVRASPAPTAVEERSETGSKIQDQSTQSISGKEVIVRTQAGDLISTKKNKKTARRGKLLVNNSGDLRKQKNGFDSWSISPATGGIFTDHDPILTADGQFLLLLTKDHVCLYSTTTSLLVRSIFIKEKHNISGGSVSPTDPSTMFVATKEGLLVKLDLSTGNKTSQWKIESGLVGIASVTSDKPGDTLLAVRKPEGRVDELVVLSLVAGLKPDSKVLLRKPNLLNSIIAKPDASIIVLCSSRKIHIGSCETRDSSKYIWYECSGSGLISNFDARIPQQAPLSNNKIPSVNAVVALDNGSIFVYEDMLSKLITSSKTGQKLDLGGRKLHWHRHGVRSVKWSRDGNYIISGGDETVLVIWQLETNQQQFLPHLSTAILNITVSATGAEYALRLGDNSVMVLSTADLSPSTNVSGLSLPSGSTKSFKMLLHPNHSNQLLAAVPIRLAAEKSDPTATHLQIYDIDTNLQLSRQALTRNITTTVNVSPDGQLLQEPDVTHIEISADGNWLATIEQWAPKTSAIEALHIKEDQTAKEKMKETSMRFWSWNADDSSWEITTRINNPHTTGHSAVLALAANPSATEFSTIGGDGFLKVWQPRRRVRDSVQVNNQAGKPLFTWTCVKSIYVQGSDSGVENSAALTYSEDGTIVAASWSHKQRYVHVIDPITGSLCMSLPHLLGQAKASLAIRGRYLLCLSTDLQVFDLITLQPTFTLDLKSHKVGYLAVNSNANAFAIGLNYQEEEKPATVSVFDVETLDQGPVSEFLVSGQLRALLAETSGRGFVTIDHHCRIRKLIPPGGPSASTTALVRTSDMIEESGKSLEDMFGHDRLALNREGEVQQRLIEDGSRTQNLVDMLSSMSTSTQPGVGELFDQVSKVIAGAQMQVVA